MAPVVRALTLLTAVAALAAAAPAQGARLIRLNGIGPLKLGMLRPDAVDTGWIVHFGSSCPYGGVPYPYDYHFTRRAPRGVNGSVEFNAFGMLVSIGYGEGVRTATGVVLGRTPWPEMVHRYRRAGFVASATFSDDSWDILIRRHHHGPVVMEGYAGGADGIVIGLSTPHDIPTPGCHVPGPEG